MGKRDILNCSASGKVVFDFRCPVGWDSMTPSESPKKRFCEGCKRDVYLCHDANEAGLRADQGECIAVPDWLADGAREAGEERRRVLIVGMPKPARELFAEVVEARLNQGSEG